MYVRGNPLRYTDPSGHFSVEQLNHMGLYEDDIDPEIWNLLLFLEPNDYLGGPNGSGQVQLQFTQSAGQKAQLGLYIMTHDGHFSPAVNWLVNYGVQNLTVERGFANTPGLQVVWSQGQTSSFWRRNVRRSTGSVRLYQQSAKWARYFDSLRDNARLYLFKEAAIALGAEWSMQEPGPGRDAGDVTFVFDYELTSDIARFSRLAREYHYRPGQDESLIGFESYSPMAPVGPLSRLDAPTLR
jgi:hypothetical protein